MHSKLPPQVEGLAAIASASVNKYLNAAIATETLPQREGS